MTRQALPPVPPTAPSLQRKRQRRKLKPLVISMGGKRQQDIIEMFSHPAMAAHFDPPVFSPGIPQRELRNQRNLLMHAGRAGILPPAEWEALLRYYDCDGNGNGSSSSSSDVTRSHLDEIFKNVPIDSEHRKGSEYDKRMHYSKELWQKAKGINRGRNVLACALAHLMAMKTLVEDRYDFILEDNVRSILLWNRHDDGSGGGDDGDDQNNGDDCEIPSCECAERIWNAMQASQEWEDATRGEEEEEEEETEDKGDNSNKKKCHLRYYGWLGSRSNLEFIKNVHLPKMTYRRETTTTTTTTTTARQTMSFFPFPIQADNDEYILKDNENNHHDNKQNHNNDNKKSKPGGTPIWGAYAYWISRQGYEALIHSLQRDVGALLWKGKRMRCYHVKPIDKILPRRVMEAFGGSGNGDNGDGGGGGRGHVHVATHPAFFRAPMLTSQIHSQWDAEFCKSTEYQLMWWWRHWQWKNNDDVAVVVVDDDDKDDNVAEGSHRHVWDYLWLNDEEKVVVEHKRMHNEWLKYDAIVKGTGTEQTSGDNG